MFKARATGRDGKPVIIIGLSDANIERLRDNKPISFDLAELGLVGHVLIVTGATEEQIQRDLIHAVQAEGGEVFPTEPPVGSILKN